MATAPVDISVIVKGLAGLQKLEKRMQVLEKQVNGLNRGLPSASNNVKRFGKSAGQASTGVGALVTQLKKAAVAIAGFEVGRRFVRVGVDAVEAERRLRALAGSFGEFEKADAIVDSLAKKFGLTKTEATKSFSQIYARLRPIGIELTDIESAFSGFNTAARLSGTSATEASAAWLQLSQALGSGVLRGEELNSVFEQTPAVVQAIAREMDVPIGQIRDLAKEGKITSDIVLKSLKRLETEGASKLAEALKGPRQQIKNVQNAFEELAVKFFKIVLPTIIKGLEVAAKAINFVSDNLKQILRIIAGFASAVAAFKVVGAVITALSKATAIWTGTIKAAAAAKAALMALLNPATIAKSLAAVGVGYLVYNRLGDAIDGATKNLEDGTDAGSDADKVFGKLNKTINGLESVTNKAGNAAETAAAKLKFATAQAEKLNKANSQEKISITKQEQFFNNRQKLTSAYYDAELKILDLKKQRAQQQGDILAVYQIEVKQAEIIYLQTLSQIKAEVQQAALKVRQVKLDTQKLRVTLLLKKAKGELTNEDRLAWKEQLNLVKMSEQNLGVVKKIADEQTRGAKAVYAASVESAKYGYNQAYVAQQAERTATAQQRGANALERQAKAARGIGDGGSGDTWKVGGKTYTFQGSASSRIVGSGISIINRSNPLASTAPQGYAEGGYVSGPTNALLGEGGESEYVIPSSKMDSAMARYARGSRGEAVTEGGGQKNSRGSVGAVVNVNTGPVMRMNNKDYVTVSDLNSALGSVASAMDGSSGNYGGSARVG